MLFAQQRVKDIASIKGAREYRLIGYGLVVGLDGTGDGRKSLFTTQAVTNMLMRLDITISPEQIRLKNVASVIVTAKIPPFASKGTQLDAIVSSLGDAKSLEGGVLLMTPLLGPDKNVYGVAQGPLSIGGFNIETAGGERIRKNYTLVGRLPEGVQLVRNVKSSIVTNNTVGILLKNPDFTTASRLTEVINQKFNGEIAFAANAGEITINLSAEHRSPKNIISFISQLESLEILTDQITKIVINERTGTVVIGGDVKIKPVAVAHGNLTIEVRSRPIVSQPGAFSSGQTVVVPQTQTRVIDDEGQLMVLDNATDVKNVALALNALGVKPRDLIAIFQALKEAGALNAELVIM